MKTAPSHFFLVLVLTGWCAASFAQVSDSAESQAEQTAAATAESGVEPPAAAGPVEGPQGVSEGPLLIGVDDAAVDAQRVDVVTNAFSTAFSGVQVWGAAFDAGNNRALIAAGSTLYEWPVGGAPNLLGTITDAAGASQAIVGLAFHGGTLYGCKNIEPEAVHSIDLATLVATVVIDYDNAFDCGGLAADPATGSLYMTNDAAGAGGGSGLYLINPNGTLTLVALYPDGQTDIDGLAIGDGRAYLVIDEPGSIYVWDFGSSAYVTPLNNPWSSGETFAGATWLGAAPDASARATFNVHKVFSDGNPAEVEVTISCNTGLPLEQSSSIAEGDGVEFVVVDFDDGEMDCEVTESVPTGYAVEYFDNVTTSNVGCSYEDVGWGHNFQCIITNSPAPVDVEIEKVWVAEGDSLDGVSTEYRIDLYCDSEIIGGNNYGETWHLWWTDEGDSVFTAQVIPNYPASNCHVEETVFDSAAEVDNACGEFTVSAGDGHSCTITNTVFFEGIPTLGRYGLAVLVLLTLGAGLIGFRRYA